MSRRLPLLLVLLAGALFAPPPARAAEHVPGEVVVRHGGAAPRTELVRLAPGADVAAAAARLARRPGVLSATPNFIARASFLPDDPGLAGAPGGWAAIQWNFAGPFGVNAPAAWDNALRAGRPGGRGVVVAVLDTGVAYANRGRFRRSPDLTGDRFRRGYDFVGNDAFPHDVNGHGTHVASTIAENLGNGVGVTGLAYGAKIMPIRVLDRAGEGTSLAIARGIRFAARNGAHIINLSFEFGSDIKAGNIPDILAALRYARAKRVLVVGASGNAGSTAIAYPARARDVLSVGATTERGCLAEYSNSGLDLDLVAPGGGHDAPLDDDPNCDPLQDTGRDIVQMTFTSDVRTFGLPAGYVGTSMAAPHVSAAAALAIASGTLGARPRPAAVRARLRATARDLGAPGPDNRYGAGLVDAAAAAAPA